MRPEAQEPEELLTPEHITYLESRRIPAAFATSLGIRSQGRALGFDYRINEETRWTKFRGPGKKFWIAPAGERLFPWNLDCLRSAPSGYTLVVTEGEFDAASCLLTEFCYCISVPNGSASKANSDKAEINPLTDTGFAYLWNAHGNLDPDIARAGKIILATDTDEPGRQLAAELAIRVGPDKCFLAQYPPDCKDANEVLVKHGIAALATVLETSIALVPDKLSGWSVLPQRGNVEGLSTGWSSLDPHLKLTFPELIVVTGKPGAGKSRWQLAWCMNLARLHGIKTAYISLEDSADRLKRHTYAYAKAWEGQEVPNADGELVVPIQKGKVIEWLNTHLRFIPPSVGEEDTRDLDWLKRIIWEAACRHDCRMFVIDPWNELEHMWDRRGMTIDEYITMALRDLKRIGRRYNIAITILAHPDKAGGRNESIDEMTLYSISGGASWKNKADGGIIIGREVAANGETGNTIIKIDKRKDWGTMGQPGSVVLAFNESNGIYSSQ